MRRVRQTSGSAGFTLIEVMMAVAIILVAVLGMVTLMERASKQSGSAKMRQTANNIMRDLLDTGQGLPYTSVTPSTIVSALQTRGFADDVTSTPATWEIKRNNLTFTVTAAVCAVDDPNDGKATHPASSNFCTDSPAGSGDSNGDDYRRITISITPPSGLGASVTGTTIVGQNRSANPGGGGGGGSGSGSVDITSVAIDTTKTTLYSGQVARCPASFLSCPGGAYGNGPTASTVSPKSVWFIAQTASTAQKVKFFVDGQLFATTPGPATSFAAQWTLPDAQPDGPYTVTAQVFDSSGNTAQSDPKPVSVFLNRYLPDPNAWKPAAGRDRLWLQSGSATSGTPEVEFYPSNTANVRIDRDVVGFQTLRFVGSASGVNGCSTTSMLIRSCQDTGAPLRPTSGSVPTLRYRVTPYAYNADGTQQLGNGSPPLSADANLANTRPCVPRNVNATRVGTTITFTWTNPGSVAGCTNASGDADSGDCVDFFRIYTRAAGSSAFVWADRADRTPFGNAVSPCGASAAEQSNSITLWEGTSTTKSYQITAVDTRLDESTAVVPANCGTSC
jgi:prepilin-type N-terminal cleavage/methylation domain-containing protein